MVADTSTISVGHTTGKLRYEVVEGRTAATYVYATYPLKFLHPRHTIHQDFDTYITYILGYGGGLVGGDSIAVQCEVGPGTAVVLGTQATTKVFKAVEKSQFVSQTFSFSLASKATLAFLPDPVTCFEDAKYRQTQVFHLEMDANLVFVDWLTSGRKRNYLATGSTCDNRKETLEHWKFDKYDTMSEIFIGGERLVTDHVCLADDENVSLPQRMYGMHVLGLMVVAGSKVKNIMENLLGLSVRKKLHNAREITPHGRLATANMFPNVIASTSALGPNAVIAMLTPLKESIGFAPYQENR
uniref:Urease accessory protein UreD n=1 Tax=Hyaloperonospora arabidopsidis (strain Emoy2) TaxID=559515 RepID=M4BNI9_HYAAE